MPSVDSNTKHDVKFPFFNRRKILIYLAKLRWSVSKHTVPNFTVKMIGNPPHELKINTPHSKTRYCGPILNKNIQMKSTFSFIQKWRVTLLDLGWRREGLSFSQKQGNMLNSMGSDEVLLCLEPKVNLGTFKYVITIC